jgi:hypothetical protein
MSFREIVGKFLGFGLVAAATIGGGFLAWYGPHPSNDISLFYSIFNSTFIAIVLWLIGAGVAGFGALVVLVELRERQIREREESLHVTPRTGPLGPPPPWGMGDIGRVGGAVKEVGSTRGGGGPKLMSVTASNLDATIIIGLLFVVTIVALVLKAHFGGLDAVGP